MRFVIWKRFIMWIRITFIVLIFNFSFPLFYGDCAMARRGRVNRRSSHRKFRKEAAKTPAINLRRAPMRGGIRL